MDWFVATQRIYLFPKPYTWTWPRRYGRTITITTIPTLLIDASYAGRVMRVLYRTIHGNTRTAWQCIVIDEHDRGVLLFDVDHDHILRGVWKNERARDVFWGQCYTFVESRLYTRVCAPWEDTHA